ncbi:MAG: hypothetical protein D3917_20535, partial [Candidatus Electrothrix sp. AX5]|nr:hypothetical protein [Candidatus Electrothrix sp. AX5]
MFAFQTENPHHGKILQHHRPLLSPPPLHAAAQGPPDRGQPGPLYPGRTLLGFARTQTNQHQT